MLERKTLATERKFPKARRERRPIRNDPPNGGEPQDWLDDALLGLEQQGLRRHRRIGVPLSADGGALLDFGSNDYLGLAHDPRLAEAARLAAAEHGWGSGASPVIGGRTPPHAQLEERLAEFEQTEAALFFPSGFAANAGVIPALVDTGDALFSDAKNHASLIDGCRLARAERFVYPHADMGALAQLLERSSSCRRRLIVTDTLFSMDGDFAPLVELGNLAERYGAMLLVDEAHATGVWGPDGRGAVAQMAVEHPRLESQVTVRVGTLSKALGASGGFVAGERRLVEWLYNRSRPYVFSTSPPPAIAAAASEALRIAQAEPERRERVARLAIRVRGELEALGWQMEGLASQIVPLRVGTPERALRLSAELAEAGCFVPAIRPPTVPEGESLLRISLLASHTDAEVDCLLRASQSTQPE